MSADEYVPSDQDMRDDHVQDRANPDAGRRQWDAWIAAHDARVRRDAVANCPNCRGEQVE